jgi:hypothetical protein
MRRRQSPPHLIVFALIVLLLIAFSIWRNSHRPHLAAELNTSDPRCESLALMWPHVYHPRRLQVVAPCLAATGTVMHIRSEPDGDLHLRMALDPGQDDLLNGENRSQQHGDLVVEVICEHNITQEDAIDACSGWDQRFELRHGEHVRVVGAYVVDREHGWMELHPVSSIDELP